MGLFSKKPKLEHCFYCSESFEEQELRAHFLTHLIEVTDDNGQRAYTFSCPRCGLMDQAWGGGRPDPQGNGVTAMRAHLITVHRTFVG